MHRIAATPGGWNPDISGIISIEQNPASICLLATADTEIQTLAASISSLPADFPTIRVVNLLQLQQQLSIDSYAEKVLSLAKVIILRLLGGRSYWSYGLEVVKTVVEVNNAALFVLPGDDRPDPDMFSHCNVSLSAVNRLWRYFIEGGVDNLANGLKFVSDLHLGTSYNPPTAKSIPKIGFYNPKGQTTNKIKVNKSLNPAAALLFYRAHYLSGNLHAIDAICQGLQDRNLTAIPIFISSLRDEEIKTKLLSLLQDRETTQIEILIDTTSFSLAKISNFAPVSLWQKLNVPIVQAILSGSTLEYWNSSTAGLTPRDVAMNVALPEVDGKIITRAISFKSVANWNETLETDIVVYEPQSDRVNFLADLVANWVKLRQTPPPQRKIAIILANYPNKDGRLANGVGLDTPASCIEILKALQRSGYTLSHIPENGDELIKLLTDGVTNDRDTNHLRPVHQYLSSQDYQKYFATLPEKVRKEIVDRWGSLPGSEKIAIPGIQLGNVFVGIQPSRGYDRDPSLNYHAPDLEPTHDYLAYYFWLREKFQVRAIIHTGKHGNLEWLPGKSIALSAECYPEIALSTIPNIYPFIVNDPGEGSQAKRRSSAVIIDHLTPPMTRAEIYGDLAKLETLIDEYYEAQTLDPYRLKAIASRINQLIKQTNLDKDLGIEDSLDDNSLAQFLTVADGYLCELKEAQIRDGLHILGQCPENKQLRDLIISIARFSSSDRIGLTEAIAKDLNLDFDLFEVRGVMSEVRDIEIETGIHGVEDVPWYVAEKFENCRNLGDYIEKIEEIAAEIIDNLIENKAIELPGKATEKEIESIKTKLLPSLQKTSEEITNLLKALDGKYVPSGASGAPTRGRPDVLPTGRNFYSVDIRAIPTETAWDTGRKAAETVIERYTQENGEYPQTLAISVWGTSTMRTGGDDIAQILALLGVQPVWDGASRRVVDFEILPVSVLGRPRVDVTVRISGFFRDSFPNLIDLVYNAIESVSSLDEPEEINPLAVKVKEDRAFWQLEGLEEDKANKRAIARIFGSKPGAYGAGLQGLIEAQNWSDDEDLARAYINWSSYAYTPDGKGHAASEAFEKRLKQLQIVLHNQDNREHDLLDSDDYYQFQGGLTAAVRSLTGKNPTTYFGDNSIPANPRVRKLKEEIARVYRTRVVNPKWIAGVMRHGYKGAFEMAATVDYLFAYDATARCVEDFMYQGVADAYLFDRQVRDFIEDKNPWVLRDMAERLLEASQRGLWREVPEDVLDRLRGIVNHAEGIVEERG